MAAGQAEKIVIAHRGASGYLPEHTLEAKVLAHAQGAHYIEQDVVMTRDDELIVMHDLYLERVTDVAARFPGRARDDGHFYVVDFSLEEIRRLRVSEPFQPGPGGDRPFYARRFPLWRSTFRVHTLAEEIELIQGLNATTGRQAGIYPEIKGPWFYHQEGKDIAAAVLRVLRAYGYTRREAPVYLQTFDFDELKRLREELLPAMDMNLNLVQLIPSSTSHETFKRAAAGELSEPYDYRWMCTAEGLWELAHYADGIGPAFSLVVAPDSPAGAPALTGLVDRAHEAGLKVHPYTFRQDEGFIPPYAAGFEDLLRIFYFEAEVDGLFTDFPDRAVALLNAAATGPRC